MLEALGRKFHARRRGFRTNTSREGQRWTCEGTIKRPFRPISVT